MALSCYALKEIHKGIKDTLQTKPSCKVLSLGYPNLLVTKSQILDSFGENTLNKIASREDSIDVAAMHKIDALVEWCPEAYSFFEALGCELHIMDFTNWSGREEVVDLNHPLDKSYFEKYDVIIDPGTTEHIFNIAQAITNVLQMVRVDGYIYHSTPHNCINHGFYNFSPTFYKDFYECNGAKLINCNLYQDDCNEEDVSLDLREVIDLPMGFSSILVKKISHLNKINYPIQGKYQNNILNKHHLEEIKQKYREFNKIALVPYNSHSKFFKEFFNDKTIKIYDDSPILNKYLEVQPLKDIPNEEFDIILITSTTFEEKIKNKLILQGINQDNIMLQV